MAAPLLLAALKRDNDDLAEHSEEYLRAVAELLVEQLEHAPKRARSVAYNLPRNPRLRRALLSGALTPRGLCAMDTAEMASDELKLKRAAAAERAEAARRHAAEAMHSWTRSVRCPECGGREAKYTSTGNDAREWHGRKNEVWGSKFHDDDDSPACLFECAACSHSWQGAAPLDDAEDESRPPPEPVVTRRGILGYKGSMRE